MTECASFSDREMELMFTIHENLINKAFCKVNSFFLPAQFRLNSINQIQSIIEGSSPLTHKKLEEKMCKCECEN